MGASLYHASRMVASAPMRTCLAVALACALAATGCSKKPTPAPATVVLPPVPAPADLIAEVVLARPAATWAALRKVAGEHDLTLKGREPAEVLVFDLP